MGKRWMLWDSRLERQVGMETFSNRDYAERVLAGVIARDARGGRPDLHDLIPYLELRERHG